MKLKDRYAAGKAQRAQLPRESHAEWKPAPHRADPIDLLVESSRGRVPELVPIRYVRVLAAASFRDGQVPKDESARGERRDSQTHGASVLT